MTRFRRGSDSMDHKAPKMHCKFKCFRYKLRFFLCGRIRFGYISLHVGIWVFLDTEWQGHRLADRRCWVAGKALIGQEGTEQ